MEKNKRTFYKIFLSFDENERKKRIADAKVFPFSDIWQWMSDEDDEGVENFKKNLLEELEAIKKANDPTVNERAKTYSTKQQRKGKGKVEPSIRNKISPKILSYFVAQDEYMQKYKSSHLQCLSEEDDINTQKQEGKISEEEANTKLAELREKYKETLKAYGKYKEKSLDFEKYVATVKFLKDVPDSVLGSLIEFKKKCNDRGLGDLFEECFNQIASEREFRPRVLETEGVKYIENEHVISLGEDNDVVRHSILNLANSGLDISFVDGGLSILHCNKQLTLEQIEALVDYCYKNGITVKDFDKLKEVMVVDKDGKELGTVEKEFNRVMNEKLNVREGDEIGPVEAAPEPREEVASSSYFGAFIPEDKIKDEALDVEKSKARIRTFLDPNGEIVENNSLLETTLCVYDNSKDKEHDNEIDKNGDVKHNKKFSIVLNRFKPKATIYLNKGKMTPDIARAVLDAYKAKGYRYFKFPPFNSEEGFGKDGQVAFLKASVKTGMVILLKGADGDGCNIGPADLKTILSEVKEEENFVRNHDQKIEYLMRWHEQIEKFLKNNPKEVKQLNDYAEKFKQQANFEYFTSSYKDIIDDEIVKGINGQDNDEKEPWDNVDIIASQYAVTQILTEMKEGYIGSKRFNPLDKEGNAKLIMEAFHKYRKQERPKIEKEIKSIISELKKDDDSRDRNKEALRRVKSRYEANYNAIVEDLKGDGVDVSMKRREATRGYVPEIGTLASREYTPKKTPSGRDGM